MFSKGETRKIHDIKLNSKREDKEVEGPLQLHSKRPASARYTSFKKPTEGQWRLSKRACSVSTRAKV